MSPKWLSHYVGITEGQRWNDLTRHFLKSQWWWWHDIMWQYSTAGKFTISWEASRHTVRHICPWSCSVDDFDVLSGCRVGHAIGDGWFSPNRRPQDKRSALPCKPDGLAMTVHVLLGHLSRGWPGVPRGVSVSLSGNQKSSVAVVERWVRQKWEVMLMQSGTPSGLSFGQLLLKFVSGVYTGSENLCLYVLFCCRLFRCLMMIRHVILLQLVLWYGIKNDSLRGDSGWLVPMVQHSKSVFF